MMETIVCVLGYSNWYIEADNKRGNSLHYLNGSEETNPSKHGFMPIKKSVSDEVVANLAGQKFPVICKMKFDLVTKGSSMDVAVKSLEPMNQVILYK